MIAKLADGKTFVLSTEHTTYAFRVLETGQLEHLYYGKHITLDDNRALTEKHAFGPGNSIAYDNDHPNICLEDIRLEMSAIGKGDIREPMIEVSCADGSTTLDFVYSHDMIEKGKKPMKTLPSSYGNDDETETLTIFMSDKNHGFSLELHYSVFADSDVIVRSARFVNPTGEPVRLRRMLSALMDFNEKGFVISNFTGAWTREMSRNSVTLNAGTFVNSSFTGTSSNRANPFTMFAREGATETAGDVFGMNLVYSGNHYTAYEVSAFDKTRVVCGINPRNFEFVLEPDADFEAPEVVLAYSDRGYTGMSQTMQDFVRAHIVRGKWADRERPVLLNSWEANYFDINENNLVSLAKKAKEVGCELFVMDDGWFGTRDDDKQALGDWQVNVKKLPHGLSVLADRINDLGLDFGIWIEPEMVNVDSDLNRAHSDWSIDIPGKDHSEGRTQRILDFANPKVVDYMIKAMKDVLSSAHISYVKWDMNRIFSDYYSKYLPAERQQEVGHRYVLGVYRLAKALTTAFPDILFEGCASGGNRFDLGMLCFFPQIWASDNTDSISRLAIEEGYSYAYPMNTLTAHVSAVPNAQTLRRTDLLTRFAVALFGDLGYELNLSDLSKDELSEIADQIALYKKFRKTLQFGTFYRLSTGNVYSWETVSADRKQAVAMLLVKNITPAMKYRHLSLAGLDPAKKYHFYSQALKHNVKAYGDLVNAVAPMHVKPDGLIHNTIARFVKIDEKGEDLTARGDALMGGGVDLMQAYVGTGQSDETATINDFTARLYFLEEVE